MYQVYRKQIKRKIIKRKNANNIIHFVQTKIYKFITMLQVYHVYI